MTPIELRDTDEVLDLIDSYFVTAGERSGIIEFSQQRYNEAADAFHHAEAVAGREIVCEVRPYRGKVATWNTYIGHLVKSGVHIYGVGVRLPDGRLDNVIYLAGANEIETKRIVDRPSGSRELVFIEQLCPHELEGGDDGTDNRS